MAKRLTSIRLSEAADGNLRVIAERVGCNDTAAIEMALAVCRTFLESGVRAAQDAGERMVEPAKEEERNHV